MSGCHGCSGQHSFSEGLRVEVSGADLLLDGTDLDRRTNFRGEVDDG
jgi:hypothetical protein